MKFHQTDRGVEIPLTIDFDLSQTLECGQCFRWNKTEDGAFQGIVKGKAISVREEHLRQPDHCVGGRFPRGLFHHLGGLF